MAEPGGGEGESPLDKEWVVPVEHDMDLDGQKPWALQRLQDVFGLVFRRNDNGKWDASEHVIGPRDSKR